MLLLLLVTADGCVATRILDNAFYPQHRRLLVFCHRRLIVALLSLAVFFATGWYFVTAG